MFFSFQFSVDKAIRVYKGPVHIPAVAALGNTLSRESNTRTVNFLYYNFSQVVFNRPGVARAVLQTPTLLIKETNNKLGIE